MTIYYKNRNNDTIHEENIAGIKYLKWLTESYSGKLTLKYIVKKKLFSILYGKFQDTNLSKSKIKDFVNNFNIDMSEAQRENISDYTNFNDFFTRKLKKESREIIFDNSVLISPADSKLMAYENINTDNMIQVKGSYYSLSELLDDKDQAKNYNNGCCLIFRLCPTDYHRFHFPDSGEIGDVNKIKGEYFSVNPIILSNVPKVYCRNKRHIATLKSDNFGNISIIEVGATCVGTIIQTYKPHTKINRGDEKGYFKFGGSTVILLLKENTVKIDDDIIKNSLEGIETQVYMGEKIGRKYDTL
ncbi:phosphatidylserine decarboxylase [Abyssisolibacter fermentans]|uniref:phosphatidylserine decarboxylase n=1 Tax=Abyssisolibacter fermentans TaxID=1766203 RepID=UPI0008364627|nr:phosphatidylserine decarboxylase [Abyssisolibacter fermentans]